MAASGQAGSRSGSHAGRLIAAADGSALGNPGPAGWAWYVDEDRWACGGWPHGTNNMGELKAVLELLRATRDAGPLTIYCDSQYVINSVTKWMAGWKRKGWKKGDGKPVLNLDLMQGIDAEMNPAGGKRDVRFEWVKGHAGHVLNEAADRLANGAALAFQRGVEPDPGPGFSGGAPPLASEDALAADSAPAAAAGSHAGVAPTGAGAASLFDPTDEQQSAVGDPELDRVVGLERALLSDGVRTSKRMLDRLLHPDWSEFESAGRILDRAATLDRPGPVATDLEVIEATRLSPDVVLLLWRAHSDDGTRLRSSVWVRDGDSWRQRFHQGTREA